MSFLTSMCDVVRTLFRVRRKRKLPPATRRPAVGARLVHGDLRMVVQAGMSDELWLWLRQLGWREVTYRPDRRRYREIPHAYVTQLIDSGPDLRQQVLAEASESAAYRPATYRAPKFRASGPQRECQ